MTIALSDVHLLTSLLAPLASFEDAGATGAAAAEFYAGRRAGSAAINVVANGLYQVRGGFWVWGLGVCGIGVGGRCLIFGMRACLSLLQLR